MKTKKIVMIAGSNAAKRGVLRVVLEAWGYYVLQAQNRQELLDAGAIVSAFLILGVGRATCEKLQMELTARYPVCGFVWGSRRKTMAEIRMELQQATAHRAPQGSRFRLPSARVKESVTQKASAA